MAVNKSATKRDDDDPITSWYDAVGTWNSKAPVAPSKRDVPGPQPEEYYSPPPRNRSAEKKKSRDRDEPPAQTYPQPRQSYSYPTSFDRSTNYGRDVPSRTGGTYTAPPPPPRSTYRVDPLKAAINKWQATTRPGESANDYDPLSSAYRPPQRTAYQVPEQQFDYGYEAPDTGASGFTSQQYQPPTRTTPTQPMAGPWQGPEEQPQYQGALVGTGSLADAWVPRMWDMSQRLARGVQDRWGDINFDPTATGRLGQVIDEGLDPWIADVGDSAAYERAQFDINQRAQTYRERGGASTWGDVVDASGRYLDAFGNSLQNFGEGVYNIATGQQTPGEAFREGWSEGDFGAYMAPAMALANTNRPTARIAQRAQDVGSYAALPFDYATTSLDVPAGDIAEGLGLDDTGLTNDMPLAPYIASGIDTFFGKLGSFTGITDDDYYSGGQFFREWLNQLGEYREAVQPTPLQITTNSPEELARNRERSFLNTLGGLRSTEQTFDDLSDREVAVNTYNQNAYKAWQYMASSDDPETRAEYAEIAAENGLRAYQLENTHPIELVNQNTNIVRQLATELLLPDWTDLAAGFFSLAELTPAARRLNRVAGEVSTPVEKVVAALDDMVVTASNKADVMAARSDYRKALDVWTVGRARSDISADKMVRYVSSLLADVESPRDAVVLLNQLASDPRRLMTGMDGTVFQSPGLLARMDETGNVRFGTMNLDRIKEPLRIYQQAAQNILQSPALQDSGPILHKIDFQTQFIEEMQKAGYVFFNVADQAENVPTAAKSGRVLGTGNSGEYVVEYLDGKKVIGQSRPMPMSEARKLQGDVGKGVAAQRSSIGEIGQFQRGIASIPYIMLSPGTWVTNIIGGIATAVGDGVFSLRSNKYIDDWKMKMWGTDPTVRGFQSVESAGSSASQISGFGPFKFLKRAYGKIDEFTGNKVFYSSANRALQKVGGQALNGTLGPILRSVGVDPREAQRIINHLHETGLQGGDLTAEFNKLLNGQTRVFSLQDVNKTWLEAVPPDGLNQLYTLIREGGAADEVLGGVYTWANEMASYWDDLIASSPPAAQRYSWQKLEVTQDTADIQQAAKQAQKHGNVAAEQAQAGVKAVADGMQEVQTRLQTLTQLVTEAGDPKNRYMLYNVWGQMTDYTANVRATLGELAEQANALSGAERAQAWGTYWTEAQRLWTDRNATVNNLLEQASTAMASGTPFTPRFDAWEMLERAARVDENAVTTTLRMEPGSGRYDARLRQVIDAGRQLTDAAQARAFAAARRFLDVDAFDYLTGAEHSAQIAGAQVTKMLEKVREAAAKSGNWDNFYSIRNEAWRQLRQYEKAIWENATRGIVREGLGGEAATGLRFDAGPDGLVELVGPRIEPGQRTSRMGPQKEVTATERTVWDVRREDGTITQITDNNVPDDLKARYNGENIDEAAEEAVDLEVANLQSAHPYAAEAQRIIDEPATVADDVVEVAPTTPSRDVPVAPTTSTVDVSLTEATPTTTPRMLLPTAQQVTTVQAKLQPVLEKVASRVGTTVDELIGVGNQIVTGLRDAPVAVQTKASSVDSILDSGGLRTYFSTGTTAGTTDVGLGSPYKANRRISEEKGLGIPRDTDDAQRPVYGYLLTNEYTRQQVATPHLNLGYGEITFVLRDEVKPRTTYTLGDSMGPFGGDRAVAIPLDGEVSPVAWGHEATAVWEYSESGDINQLIDSVGYLEAQIQGGVRLSDIDSVLDPNNTLTPQQIQRLQGQGIEVVQSGVDDMVTYDFTLPNNIEDIAKQFGINLWGGAKLDEVGSLADDISRRTTQAGGTHPGELGHGAAFAKQQLENIVDYIENNINEILTPRGKLIGDGQNLRALQEFRTKVLPAWDNVKYAAGEYGNRMRSFSMVDFANNTRLDEILSLYMPYGFWMTRTAKNSLERAMFEPHIWRRVMQTENAVRDTQEQNELPQRYEGTVNTGDWGGEYAKMLRFLPGKYWPLAGMFTHNDYADPESANSALGFASESLRAANMQSYPWWDAALKLYQGEADEIYPANYTPQGRIIANLALKFGGWDAANRWTIPGFFENSTARTLSNMATKGTEIDGIPVTRIEAIAADDYLNQLKNNNYELLPEFENGVIDNERVISVLDAAVRETAGVDLWSALSSFATGFGIKLWDDTEQEWRGSAQNYREYGYGPENQYGSKMAKDTQKPLASLSWNKSAVWNDTEDRPGISLATELKDAEQDRLNAELMDATDEFILGYEDPEGEKERPSNFEINNFKNSWMAEQTGGSGEYFVTDMNAYLDERYPSATEFEGSDSFAYQGYAPEEVRQRARVGAYYQAKEELQAQNDALTYPTYPGDNATSSQWDTYWKAREQYDADKAAYDAAVEARTDELINDPAALQKLTRNYGLDLTNDYTRSLPPTMETVFGEPRRPTGGMPEITPGMTNDTYQAGMTDLLDAGQLYDEGLTPLAGDPEDAAAIIEQEKTKYMSDLEAEVRAANEAEGDNGYSSRGYSRNSYSRRPWVNYGRGGYSRGYSRRGYGGGGGGGAGGNYYAPQVESRGLSEWLYADPQRAYYEAPRTQQRLPDIGPEKMQAWRPISWR